MTQSAARGWFVATFLLALSALASSAPRADAAPKKVLFVTFDGGYNSDGFNAKSELETYVTSLYGQGQVDYLVLSSNGQVAAALAANTYEQIWTYDLSTGADDYPLDYAAIASWYSAAPLKEVICDGRFLSSFWAAATPPKAASWSRTISTTSTRAAAASCSAPTTTSTPTSA
jgi:hypothetical protein